MRRALHICAALLLLSAAPMTQAQDGATSEQQCSRYDPDPACTKEERDYWRGTFGLPTLGALHHRRGEGHDLIVGMIRVKTGERLAIVFHENRNGTATAEIYRRPRREKHIHARQPIRVEIPSQTWRNIVAQGRALPDVFARDEIYTCGATFMIEFRDAQGVVRSPVGDACGDEPRGEYFKLLAQAVIAELPRCRSLTIKSWESSIDQLKACRLL